MNRSGVCLRCIADVRRCAGNDRCGTAQAAISRRYVGVYPINSHQKSGSLIQFRSNSRARWDNFKREEAVLMQPIFRWAGSKRYLADTLLPKFPSRFDRYVEPFCGSASLFCLSEPPKALLTDINEDLINAFKQIVLHPKAIAQISSDLPSGEEDYYAIRMLDPNELSPIHRAARFVYLNRLCFNGLYRTNVSGKFNVPYSGYRTPPPRSCAEMVAAARILKRASFSCIDFRACLDEAKRGDFFYLDPPYVSIQKKQFTDYYKNTFNDSDILDLHSALLRMSRRGVKFMLSYSNCEEVAPLKKEWKSEIVYTRRNIAGFAGSRKIAEEILIKNY